MRCNKCGSEWKTNVSRSASLTVCPFCHESLVKKKTPEFFDSAKDVLCYIANNKFVMNNKLFDGREILLSEKIVNFFSDMAPALQDEKDLIKIIREKGALEILRGAMNSSPPEQGIAIKRAAAKLPSFMDAVVITSILYEFAEALGWELNAILPPLPKVGSIYRFGNYDWRVLDVQDGKALLLSDLVITNKPYHESFDSITWENCTLRREYLNNELYNSFSEGDKKRIIETTNRNSDNLWFDTAGGSDTCDKIFLLSLEEVDKYFGDSADYLRKRRKKYDNGKFFAGSNGYHLSNTYNYDRIANNANGEAHCWWLRSPGNISSYAAYVFNFGNVIVFGSRINHISAVGGVRPALWLNL